MTMTLDTPAPDVIVEEPGSRRTGHLRRVARPALGLLLPLGLALAWELAVRFGYSNGRLVPPPSRIWQTLVELMASGELGRHIIATLSRVGAGFGLGIAAGTVLGAICGYW
ncbi:MAG: ABC transporter permease, partial [Afipia sp.]